MCQFTSILRAAFVPIFLHQKVQTLNVSTKKLRAKLSYEKPALKMLLILTQGIVYGIFPTR
jgi:hypothetical protein